MGQHRALGDAGGAAGVLQEGKVVVGDRHVAILGGGAAAQRLAEVDRAVDAPVRHHLLHVLDDVVDDPALGHRQHVAHLGGDHVLDAGLRDHLLQRVREILDDHDGLRARVAQLVLEFARRVERVHVHDRHAGAQRPEQRDRVLQQVGHHDRDAFAGLHAGQRLQEGGEVAGLAVEVGVAHRHAHVGKRRTRREALAALFQDVLQRTELIDVDLGGHALRIAAQPGSVGHAALLLGPRGGRGGNDDPGAERAVQQPAAASFFKRSHRLAKMTRARNTAGAGWPRIRGGARKAWASRPGGAASAGFPGRGW